MFVRFTRLDNSPVWLNAAFVVTVEPRRDGGSIVVPIGDGLDYDVKESPEQVLAMLANVPVPAVVPVPSPTGLTHTPADVSPDPDIEPSTWEQSVEEQRERGLAPAADYSEAAPSADDAASDVPSPSAAAVTVADATPAAAAKPPRTRRKRAAGEADKPAPAKPRPRRKAKAAKSVLDGEQLARLRRLAPGSLRKLHNTLASQFKVEDVETETAALASSGVIVLERDHVVWVRAIDKASEIV